MKQRKILLFGSLLFLHTTMGRSETPSKQNLSAEDLCRRLEVTADVFIYDKDGKALENKLGEMRKYRAGTLNKDSSRKDKDKNVICTIQSSMGHRSNLFDEPRFIVAFIWDVMNDKTMRLHIEQFAQEEGRELKDSLGKEDIVLTEFTPFKWTSKAHKQQRVVLRLTPDLINVPTPQNIDKLPIGGDDILVTDNTGRLWANNFTISGVYISMKTANGLLALSYYQFPGSERIGVARGKTIELSLPNKIVTTVTSKTDFVPNGVSANVYGYYNPSLKTARFTSQQLSSGSAYEEWQDRVPKR